jgi:hypothetical protein
MLDHRKSSYSSFPGVRNAVAAESKELRTIGWRVGWIDAPEPISGDLALVSMANVVAPVGFRRMRLLLSWTTVMPASRALSPRGKHAEMLYSSKCAVYP